MRNDELNFAFGSLLRHSAFITHHSSFIIGAPMLIIPRIPFRRHAKPSRSTPPALTLVAASYDENDAILKLRFDRAIDASAWAPGQIVVKDGVFNTHTYQGAGS